MKRVLGQYLAAEVALLGLVEFALAFLVIYAAVSLPGMRDMAAARSMPADANLAAMLAMTVAATAATIGLYRVDICLDRRGMLRNVLIAVALAFPATLLMGQLLHVGISSHAPIWLAGALLFWLLAIVATRQVFGRLMRTSWFARRVLIAGSGPRAAQLIDRLRNGSRLPFEPVPAATMALDAATLRANRIWAVIVATDLDGPTSAQLLDCKLRGMRIVTDGNFTEQHLGRIDLDTIDANWLIYADGFRQGRLSAALKRVTDVVICLALLVTTLPLMLLTALFVRLESPGPVLYRQQRVGLHGQPFTLFKFRSMRLDAEAAGAPRWAQRQDPRITRVGGFIRPMRIDELPQLINVLRGEMSMIGPRPERPHFVEQLGRVIPFYHQRSCVKPGLTGWAQICFPYGASIADAREKLSYDLYYVKNRSLLLDLMILAATIRVVLFREGAR